MAAKSTLRDKLRAMTLGGEKTFAKEVVKWNDEEFLVRQPSVSQRGEIIKASKLQVGDVEKIETAYLQVYAVVYCTYTPDGAELVFDENDVPALLAEPSGSFVDVLSEAAMRLMNVEADAQVKNSKATQTDSSSTGSQKTTEDGPTK